MNNQTFSKETLFDLIAPIHICQKADLLFEKKAKSSFSKLKKLKKNPIVIEYFGEDIEVLDGHSLNHDKYHAYWRVYNRLFKEVVLEKFPQFETAHDFHGAKCFKFDGNIFLDGDDYDCYPFYETYSLLQDTLKDLMAEI